VVETLLETSNADLNVRDDRGQTALHKAAAAGWSELVEELLDMGADAAAVDNKGRTPAYLACRAGDLETFSCILGQAPETGKIADAAGHGLAHCAAQHGHLGLLEFLRVGKHVTPSDIASSGGGGLTPMHAAAMHGHVDCVRHLADLPGISEPTVNAADDDDRTPVMFAAMRGHQKVVETLLEKGAGCDTVDKHGRGVLHYAAGSGAAGLCALLAKAVRDDQPPSERMLCCVAWHACLPHCWLFCLCVLLLEMCVCACVCVSV
jgi:ankyrin repeat protein